MTDDPSTHSGSRWEPIEAPAPPADEIHAPIVPAGPVTRARLLLAAGAVALLGVGGAGGFAVGHAIAGTGDGSSVVDRNSGFGGIGDPDGDAGPGGVPPGGLPGGTVPDQDGDTDSGAGAGTGSPT